MSTTIENLWGAPTIPSRTYLVFFFFAFLLPRLPRLPCPLALGAFNAPRVGMSVNAAHDAVRCEKIHPVFHSDEEEGPVIALSFQGAPFTNSLFPILFEKVLVCRCSL